MVEPSHLDDNETIFRRIPVSTDWYDADQNEVKPDAFRPKKYDLTGISVSRVRSEVQPDFLDLQQIAQGRSSQGYYIVQLSVRTLRENRIDVVAKPLDDNPGHAELPQLTYENRKSKPSQEIMVLLAHKLVEHVHGPSLRDQE